MSEKKCRFFRAFKTSTAGLLQVMFSFDVQKWARGIPAAETKETRSKRFFLTDDVS